ncbi:hypothetical protein ACFLZP_01700 [Patescibacteria group bacterium]
MLERDFIQGRRLTVEGLKIPTRFVVASFGKEVIALPEQFGDLEVFTIIPDAPGPGPRTVSELLPALAEQEYEGMIIAQIILSQEIDITEAAVEAYKRAGCSLYCPPEELKRDLGIRGWVYGADLEVACPPKSGFRNFCTSEETEIDLGLSFLSMQTTIVRPDIQLNRAVLGADCWGDFAFLAWGGENGETFVGGYNVNVAWDGVTKVEKVQDVKPRYEEISELVAQLAVAFNKE